ncbi:TetR/AcrR family transcriptional regulator [Mycobacterium sp. NPDC050551]|uniref:TetR/AcrR family transcriptional regulator n=1 Tax=Mycobacterium sp. NPDC050551 TaxID=3155407 RepID=UPI00344522DE
MPPAAGVRADRRKRPKDRKQQIAGVSAEAFSELGYHGVSMEDIAGRVGVTAASLYRHYSRKYDLFRAAVLGLGEQLDECTAFLDSEITAPERTWDRAVDALVDATLKNRTSGGLYRWEGRYLEPDDQLTLNGQIKLVNRRLQQPLSILRPDLDSRQRWILSSAVLSVIGSITDHRARLPNERVRATLAAITRAVRDAELPSEVPDPATPPVRTVGAAAGEYEQILHAAMLLFNDRGYRDTGMDDIAEATGLATSAIYRFFTGKSAILAAAYRRAADRVSGDVSAILAAAADCHEAVHGLADAYVRRSFASPEVAYVYYAERVNVPAPDRVALHNMQRATVEAWVRQVTAARPDLVEGEARFAVHAAFALVVDLGRLVQYVESESSQAVVRELVLTTLLGAADRRR